jgi:DNA-binding NarL/FixJ family response regulator
MSKAPLRSAKKLSIIRVVIVEDDEWHRKNFVIEISQTRGFQCLGSFPSAELALKEIPSLKPDVVLMDINLPGMDGVQCVRRLKEVCPQIQFLMLTAYGESDRIFDSLQAGARGYLFKRAATEELFEMEELCEAIQQVMKGRTLLTDQIVSKIVQHFNQLGER